MMASVVANGNRKTSLSLKGVDPETCMIVFRNHWAQVVKILEKHDPVHNSGGGCLRLGPIPGDEASAVQNYVEHMLLLLMEEEPGQGGAMGAILEFVVVEGVMERLFLWSLRRHFTDDMKLEQLRMYQMLLSQARQPLLHHKPVLRPLMMLLSSCAGAGAGGRGGGGGSVEAELVLLLNQLCGALAKDPSVLELFFHTSEDQGAANFLLFSLLIPFTHQEGSVGQQARDALLLIMQLSAHNPRVATHITDNTYFCPVLATGLSGLYSSLPAKLQVYSEDWHCLERADWIQVPALVQFLNSLQFCCSVIKVGHPSIRGQLLGYIYNGFLVPVLAPALHKCTLEEVMTTTAYLDLFLRSVSEPALLQTFLSFILLHTHDNVQLLDTLVSRVNTPFQLGTVSLALFRTLIGLFCEDVMLQLILRYLIPCTHLCVRERRSLKDRDTYSSSAVNFLFLTPSWCPLRPGAVNTHTQHIHWAMGTDVPMSEGDSVGYSRICRTDFLMNVNYLQYLWDARVGIAASLQACLVWSGPYDGVNPAPREEEDGEEEREEEKTDRTFNWTSSPGPPLTSPPHIQEMRRSAIMLIQGSYVEESDFQYDVLVYNLIAQKDADRRREVEYKPDRRREVEYKPDRRREVEYKPDRRREVEYKPDRRREVEYKPDRRTTPQTRTPAVNKEVDDDRKRTPSGPHLDHNCNLTVTTTVTNDLNAAEHQERTSSENHTHPVLNGLPDVEKQQYWNKTDADHPVTPITTPAAGDNFLSQYRELMRSLGAEPDDVTDDITEFRKRVLALAQGGEEEEDADLEPENSPGLTRNSQDRKHGIPFTGPFISVLLSRLENLLENPIPVNLLVTGILSQLAKYPQPLLRAFLLNTHTDPQPNVRTLYQVLVSVRVQIEQYAVDQTEFPATVREAWRYLLARDQALKLRELPQDSHSEYRKSVLPNGNTADNAERSPLSQHSSAGQNRVFATVLYAEFLKELAAIAQEHSIVPDSAIED
ncbi:LOW QUALITY PROTEIN: FHF complex subunit HOOK-interacting protein 1A-like [Salvelinus alpinus]